MLLAVKIASGPHCHNNCDNWGLPMTVSLEEVVGDLTAWFEKYTFNEAKPHAVINPNL